MTYLCVTSGSSGQRNIESWLISQSNARFWGVPGVSTSVAVEIDFTKIDMDTARALSVALHLRVGALDGLGLGCCDGCWEAENVGMFVGLEVGFTVAKSVGGAEAEVNPAVGILVGRFVGRGVGEEDGAPVLGVVGVSVGTSDGTGVPAYAKSEPCMTTTRMFVSRQLYLRWMDGFVDGFDDGFAEGFAAGFAVGTEEGILEGAAEGVDDKLILSCMTSK